MENKYISDYHESQVREVISVQVLPNCSAGLDSDNAVGCSVDSHVSDVWN